MSTDIKFALGQKSNEEKTEIKEDGVVGSGEVVSNDATPPTPILPVEDDNELLREYLDERSVTISLVENYSLYRKVNKKALVPKIEYIGSSVNSSRILSSNKEEVETYFPNIIGLSPNHDEFTQRVKQYLNNIRIKVDGNGKTLNTSFNYRTKKDYNYIRNQEEKIEQAYKMADKSDIAKLKEALKIKIDRINALEASKCKLGYPINIDDYLMYRHCLFYRDIAKDVALINSDNSIRFYFKDDVKEKERMKKYQREVTNAKANYVACMGDDALFESTFIQMCINNGEPIIYSLHSSRLDKEVKLERFSNAEPIKFNKMVNNPDGGTIATIEKLIAYGELIRAPHNQNIISPDGTFVGANMTEAILWFKNPENGNVVASLLSKLKHN